MRLRNSANVLVATIFFFFVWCRRRNAVMRITHKGITSVEVKEEEEEA